PGRGEEGERGRAEREPGSERGGDAAPQLAAARGAGRREAEAGADPRAERVEDHAGTGRDREGRLRPEAGRERGPGTARGEPLLRRRGERAGAGDRGDAAEDRERVVAEELRVGPHPELERDRERAGQRRAPQREEARRDREDPRDARRVDH